jgi:hypothetical protein
MMQQEVLRALVQRSVGVLTGIAMTFSIPLFLSPEQQGYYYTFASVLAIQIFFELGLSQVLLYKFSSLAPNVKDSEHSKNLESSARLLYVSRRIYVLLSALFFVFGSTAGCIFFSRSHYVAIEWMPQWILLVLFTSVNLAQSIKFVFLESHGGLANVATFRLRLNLVSSLVFLLILFAGGGLWSVIVLPAINSVASTLWIYKSGKSTDYRKHRVLATSISLKDFRQIWRRDIFPLQWRMSISWLSGYFIFQLITPIAFTRFGPVVAGQLGFAVSAMNSILFVATTFSTAISPRLSSLFHGGQIDQFNYLFDKGLRRSLLAAIFLTQAIVALVFSLSFFRLELATRFLAWQPLLIYSVCVVISAVVYCLAIYLRSQAIEPLVRQSAMTALVMAPMLWVFSSISLEAMLAAMLFVTFGSSIAVLRIYRNNRKSLLLGSG